MLQNLILSLPRLNHSLVGCAVAVLRPIVIGSAGRINPREPAFVTMDTIAATPFIFGHPTPSTSKLLPWILKNCFRTSTHDFINPLSDPQVIVVSLNMSLLLSVPGREEVGTRRRLEITRDDTRAIQNDLFRCHHLLNSVIRSTPSVEILALSTSPRSQAFKNSRTSQ